VGDTTTFRTSSCTAWLLGGALVAGMAGVGACGPKKAATQPPVPPVTAQAEADEDADACRNWSDLDLSTLEPIPESQWSETLEVVWRTVWQKHYDPTLSCLDWPALRLKYAAELVEAKADADAYAIMNKLLGELGQSHLAIIAPRKRVEGEPRSGETAGTATVPLRARVVEGKVVVTHAAVDGVRSGVPAGAQLVGIDDDDIAPLIEQQRALWKRDVEVDLRVARTVEAWLSCEPGAKRTIRYVAFGKDKEAKKTVKCFERKVERTALGNLKNVPIEVQHRMLDGKTGEAPRESGVGYLYFNVWMMPLVPQIEQAMIDLRSKGMTSLVLDLRGNPGGVGMMSVPLARQLLAESGTLGVMRMRDADQHFKFTASDDPFTGPVVVLVDEGTGSTSEIFAQGLRDLDRIKVVGASSSQGAALPSLVEELPGGALLQYVVADYVSPAGTAVEGRGVAPDVSVQLTQADFAKGKDPVLAAAVTVLTEGVQ
jgi:carboxyl-terminal processing protease